MLKRIIGRLRAPKPRAAGYPPGPRGVTLYAIGDVHGRIDCLLRVQASIDRDRTLLHRSERVLELYIGDYVDRGPDSAAVLDNLVCRAGQTEMIALRGNHEMLMTSAMAGEVAFADWRRLGGLETAMAYGFSRQRLAAPGAIGPADLMATVPQAHRDFLASLHPHFVLPPYCFVHAGLRPGVPLERQSERDLAWIRDDFLNYRGAFGYVVVHGHTPVRAIEFHPHRINIDTGAYLSNKLSVLRIDASGPAPLEVEAA